ncbi:MAG: hypothetical protein C0623_08045 [Desulfuromonas sp.]|nr:MAG: hypothetical protein C0623_08045 [Desulfuromonas sp.]
MKVFWGLLTILILAGCATSSTNIHDPALQQRAREIIDADSADVAQCQKLNLISVDSRKGDADYARFVLKVKAAEIGATHILWLGKIEKKLAMMGRPYHEYQVEPYICR